MGYWGWRRLCTVFVSVWVVGCSITHPSAPTALPTLPPLIPLITHSATRAPLSTPFVPPLDVPLPISTPIYYSVAPGDTLLGIARRFGVGLEALRVANDTLELDPLALPVGQLILIPDPPFDASGQPILATAVPTGLQLGQPTCYPTPTNTVLCLGLVHNSSTQPVSRVNLRVRLLRADGSLLADGETGLEQAVIPAESSAPYHAQFAAQWRDYSAAWVVLRSADVMTMDDWVVLLLEREDVRHEADRYTVAALLRNTNPYPARVRRAVLTVLDSSGNVAGYRVLPLEQHVAAGEALALQLSAQAQSPPARHLLYVEAEAVRD
ncbi:MAG: LysM peptidoglycan-binding domain-containing protein [Anaerolineae bacterium]|nr:LysM peptidoglycan-binding domain-containing protein [Anaerolineae bacterium]